VINESLSSCNAFHSSILFDENADDIPRREDQITRAWDGLLQNRVLVYCK
jgi:hypothetical protein